MKRFIFLLCHLISILSFCQNKGNTYNTDINVAKNVEIKDGHIYIKQADTVIVKIEVVEKKYNLIVDSVFTLIDTAKNFITIIKFVNKESPRSELNLDFSFDQPIEGIAHRIIGSGSEMAQQNFTLDKKRVFLTGYIFAEQ